MQKNRAFPCISQKSFLSLCRKSTVIINSINLTFMSTATLKKAMTIREAMAIIEKKQAPYIKEWMTVEEVGKLLHESIDLTKQMTRNYDIIH
jgi:Fe-S cluster biosynthesis and repair protein YggX